MVSLPLPPSTLHGQASPPPPPLPPSSPHLPRLKYLTVHVVVRIGLGLHRPHPHPAQRLRLHALRQPRGAVALRKAVLLVNEAALAEGQRGYGAGGNVGACLQLDTLKGARVGRLEGHIAREPAGRGGSGI